MIRIFLIIFICFSSAGIWIYFQIPSEKELRGCLVTKMYGVHLCPGSKDYVPLRQISPVFQKAVIMSEDAAFWSHHGFDWDELEKSARTNLEKGQYKRGGSTISQQLAKNLFLSKEKSLFRKALEALITLQIERRLKKTEILERYLNVVEFGPDIFGIKSASNYYFHKGAGELNAAESAFLAMLLPSPKRYSKSFRNKKLSPFAQKRTSRILSDLAMTGKISAEEHERASTQMLNLFGENSAQTSETPASDSDEESADDTE